MLMHTDDVLPLCLVNDGPPDVDSEGFGDDVVIECHG